MIRSLLHRLSAARLASHVGSPRRSHSLRLTALEDRTVPALATVVAADAGGGPHVKVFDEAQHEVFSFFAYDAAFRGGVRVALGDVNGDGTPDVVTAAGPGGGAHVKVFSGKDLSLLANFFAYDAAFRGGVFVGLADVDGDGNREVVTGPGVGGGPHVKVFDVVNGQAVAAKTPLASFLAYDVGVTGGLTVTGADLNGDHRDEIVTVPFRGSTHVKAFDAATGALVSTFFAFDPLFVGGGNVSAGDVDYDGRDEILVGAGLGGGGNTRVFGGADNHVVSSVAFFDGVLDGFNGGVRVQPLSIQDGTSNTIQDGTSNTVRLVGTPSGGFASLTATRNAVTGQLLPHIEQDNIFSGFGGGSFVATNRNSILIGL
ncbi:MAG: hypothetical protein U0746_17465 [Gemmataceae bacterium]